MKRFTELLGWCLIGVLVTYGYIQSINLYAETHIHIAKIEASSRIQAAHETAKGGFYAAQVTAAATVEAALAPVKILEKRFELEMRFLKAKSEGGPRNLWQFQRAFPVWISSWTASGAVITRR
jgi:hypothetical protein